MGTVLSRSPGWTETDMFNINGRFKYVWDHIGDIEKSNALFTDMIFGKRGAIRLSDAMSGISCRHISSTCTKLIPLLY